MRSFTLFKGFVVFAAIVGGWTLPNVNQKRAQCELNLETAESLVNALQAQFWDGAGYTNGITWTNANTFEDINNLMLATSRTDWAYVNTNSTLAKLGLANAGNWDAFFQGSFDDAQWVILMLWKMADYRASKGEDISALMGSAAAIYDYVSAEWDTTVCGGGVWWSGARDYKNAVVNELYILTSANGFLRTGNQTYLDNAKKTWDWLSKSGMRNSEGLFNDGLVTATCQNNGQTTWIYNQGVIASGLANLGVATKDPSLFDQAEITLDAAIQHLTVNGVLKESCDNASSPNGQCDHDQQMFKGIFTKHLQYYLDMVNDPARTAKYAGFLHAQESAVVHFGKNSANITGSVWYAPDAGGSVFTAETAASGIAASVAAAKYGTCAP